jgi:hypothetical protein
MPIRLQPFITLDPVTYGAHTGVMTNYRKKPDYSGAFIIRYTQPGPLTIGYLECPSCHTTVCDLEDGDTLARIEAIAVSHRYYCHTEQERCTTCGQRLDQHEAAFQFTGAGVAVCGSST